MSKNTKGLIFNIQRFSVHDGPGIRTTIFMKGCPLSCLWCFNPEGIKNAPELMWHEEKCKRCFNCINVCPNSAIIYEDDLIKTNREMCNACGECEKVCYFGAREIVGEYMTVKEVLSEILKDEPFYKISKGGVTISGGEVTFQNKFALKILEECRKKCIHTAIDTCGYTTWRNLKKILPYVNLVLYDLKQIDKDKHKEYTGVLPNIIYSNLKQIDKVGIPIWIRIPIIPGYTDQEENISGVASFISKVKSVKKVELLPYQEFSVSKYKSLGLKYSLELLKSPNKNRMKRLEEIFRCSIRNGIEIKIG